MRTGVKPSSLAMVGSSLWHARVFGEATECQIPSQRVCCPGILLYCIPGTWMQALRFRESYQFESVRRTAIYAGTFLRLPFDLHVNRRRPIPLRYISHLCKYDLTNRRPLLSRIYTFTPRGRLVNGK